jgi:uncharacterized protein (DUF433 family)
MHNQRVGPYLNFATLNFNKINLFTKFVKTIKMEATLLNRITIKPDICNGKPTVRGMRITVETILQYLSAGDTVETIIDAYPFLEKEDIQACILY